MPLWSFNSESRTPRPNQKVLLLAPWHLADRKREDGVPDKGTAKFLAIWVQLYGWNYGIGGQSY
jgi:hypothetical protein